MGKVTDVGNGKVTGNDAVGGSDILHDLSVRVDVVGVDSEPVDVLVEHLHAVGLHIGLVDVFHVHIVARPFLHLVVEVSSFLVLAVVLVLRSGHLLLLISGVVLLIIGDVLVHSMPVGSARNRRGW